MNDFLHKIQKLSEFQRKALAVLTMIIISPLVFYFFAGIFKGNLAIKIGPENTITPIEQKQIESNPSPIDWVVESATAFKANILRPLYFLLEAVEGFADDVAEAEQKLLPGFNQLLAGILQTISFWK